MKAAVLVIWIAGCDRGVREPATAPSGSAIPGSLRAVVEDDGNWPMAPGDYASTRFSALDQIDASNVSHLKVAWTFSTGATDGHEAAPIIVGDTMYVISPYPNIVYALDLNDHGRMKWKFDPKPEAAAQGVACCDTVNRGVVWSNGRIFFNTLDGQTIALDAATGEEIWRAKLGNIHIGETITMAPLVVKDKVLVGNSGGEFGVRGWLAALNTADGTVAWKAFMTGPDSEVLIGPRFKPFYAMDQGKDLGVKSWPPGAWEVGGGTVWGWISYDPELNLIYHGTANPGPWNHEVRPGDNKWTCGIFARDADSGEAVWFYQFTPHDVFDHDAVNEQILLDLEIEGRVRKVLVRPERNGYMYVMDRQTGEVISANAFAHLNTTAGVDLQSGRLITVKEKEPKTGIVIRDICPSASGAKDWQPSAFSPRTGLLYVPHQNLCMDMEGTEANYIAGTPYVGANVKYYPGPGGHMGEFTAWDPVAGKARWKIRERFPVWSGTVVTAGDLAFYGTMEGWFKAIDARSGRELWKFKTGSGIIGQPVSYRGPDGKQYIAVFSGIGGWPGAIVSANLDTRDAMAGTGWGAAMTDLPDVTTKGGTLYVFSLP